MPSLRCTRDSSVSIRRLLLKKICWPTCLLAALTVVLGRAADRADSVISPFVDSQTNAVIYLDFSAIDMDTIDAW